MLKGISNIDKSSGAETSGKNLYRRYISIDNIRQNDAHDSLNISKGYRILRDYDIDLKRFRKNDHGLIEVKFELMKIEFGTQLNIENLTNLLKLEYEVNKAGISTSVLTRTLLNEHLEELLKLNNIEFILERINALRIDSEINMVNTKALSNLLDGAYNGVLNEFKQINSILTTAAKNIFNFSIKKLPPNDLENEFVIIDKITPINEQNK